MPKTARDVPPPLELMCLNALWSKGEGSVKDVRAVVAATRPLAYTTIMTVLERLVRKGKLSRRKSGRAFLYAPQASLEATRRAAVRELVNGFFHGSEDELRNFLSAAEQTDSPAAALPTVEFSSGIDTTLL
jgi:predicted transcriptional regulator